MKVDLDEFKKSKKVAKDNFSDEDREILFVNKKIRHLINILEKDKYKKKKFLSIITIT